MRRSRRRPRKWTRLMAATVAVWGTVITAMVASTWAQPLTVEELQRRLDERDQVIWDLLQRIKRLEQAIQKLGGQEIAPVPQGAPGQTISQVTPSSPLVAREEEREAQPGLERVLIERGGLLLPRGSLEVEESLTYTTFSRDVISINGFAILPALVVGEIVSERVRRDILTPAFTARYGLLTDLQGEVRVPYVFQWDRRTAADGTTRSVSDSGVGDVEVAVQYQALRERGALPDTVLGLRWKSTTGKAPFGLAADELPLGSGFHGLRPTVTLVKSSDPVALFGNLGYTVNLPRSTSLGGINPGGLPSPSAASLPSALHGTTSGLFRLRPTGKEFQDHLYRLVACALAPPTSSGVTCPWISTWGSD